MDNGAPVPKHLWHMANKPACTHGGPTDTAVCMYAHTYTDTHAQFLFHSKKLQTEETQSEYKYVVGHLESVSFAKIAQLKP